jgi:hypothetical protein
METHSKRAHSQVQRGYVVVGQGYRAQHGFGCGASGPAAARGQAGCVLHLKGRPARFVGAKDSPAGLRGMLPNMSFERTVGHRGPRLAAARSSWPAAQLGR